MNISLDLITLWKPGWVDEKDSGTRWRCLCESATAVCLAGKATSGGQPTSPCRRRGRSRESPYASCCSRQPPCSLTLPCQSSASKTEKGDYARKHTGATRFGWKRLAPTHLPFVFPRWVSWTFWIFLMLHCKVLTDVGVFSHVLAFC